jgi:hypothetical protein
VRETLAIAEHERDAILALDADLQASLALSRATLRALAALSPVLNIAAEAALEEEVARAAACAAPQRTLDIVEEVRQRLRRAPAEARIASALERALVDAAEALPFPASRVA